MKSPQPSYIPFKDEQAFSRDKIGNVKSIIDSSITEFNKKYAMISNTPLQIEISLVRMENHNYKNTGMEYLEKFYIPSSELFTHKFDGMSILLRPMVELTRILSTAPTQSRSSVFMMSASCAMPFHTVCRYLP